MSAIFDETGPFDATTHRDTVRAYFDEVNAAGGVNGYRLQLMDCDSAFDPTRAHQCSDRLLNQGILAFDRQGYHPKILAPGLDKPSAEKQYGTAVYGAESLTWYLEPDEHLTSPAMSEYLNTVQHYYPNQVAGLDVYAEGSWIAAKVFVEAVRRIGPRPVNPASLVAALNSITNFDTGLTVPLSYGPGASHDPNHCIQWIRNQQGTWHTYSGWNCF